MDRAKIKKILEKIPLSCGVYIMKSKEGEVLYVGKASSLRRRVSSYFYNNQMSRLQIMIDKVEEIDYVECNSEEQALILEAYLIKEKKPKYNVYFRDDKSYPYIEITNEEFPCIRIVRLSKKEKSLYDIQQGELFGPYPQASLLKASLNIIRKIFPYRSCYRLPKKVCLYYHMRLCPGPCANFITKGEYRESIEHIKKILRGEKRELIEELTQKMKECVSLQEFEKASIIRDKIFAIENLYAGKGKEHQLIALKNILGMEKIPYNIEAIDVSSLGGKYPTGSVVVFRQGYPDKSSYRRYKILTVKGIDDYGMIKEVVFRRYRRLKEEGGILPELLIIDGGKGQIKAAKEELDKLGLNIFIIGIAKKKEEIFLENKEAPLDVPLDNEGLHLIQYIRDEAHRFAHKYHLYRRKKGLMEGAL